MLEAHRIESRVWSAGGSPASSGPSTLIVGCNAAFRGIDTVLTPLMLEAHRIESTDARL
jgi:hypothetical protein